MTRLIENRIVIVIRKTRLDDLVVRYNTIEQARFYIEHLGARFDDYELEHTQYYQSLAKIRTDISNFAKIHILDRSYLPNYIFAPNDIVIVIGQDGLVANTLKYLNGQMTIGVNPDPGRWDGVLLPFNTANIVDAVHEAIAGRRPIKTVTLALASLQNGQRLLAVNDLFIGHKSHSSARYSITYANKTEQQSSSGIIVSTGLGSSGWLKSVLAGASGIVNTVSKSNFKIKNSPLTAWDADYLTFSVREPFPSKTTGVGLVFGKVAAESALTVTSLMGENGVIFSDGIENDFLEFNSGTTAKISLAEMKGRLVV
ncbi:MAG: sugar kinase [Burkholderiales bacterium]|jgi:NAD kinase|nr:sugar kinase [Burkholderiales bacterium]